MRRSTLLLLALLAEPAHGAPADATMDSYQSCWISVVRNLSLEKPGAAKERAAKRLMSLADKVCGPQSDAAARLNSLQAVKDMRQYMAVQFYNANFQMDTK